MDIKCFFGTFTAVLFHKGVVEGGTGSIEEKQPEVSAETADVVASETVEAEQEKELVGK